MRRLLAPIVALGLVAPPAMLAAADQRVSYADLDLSTAAGRDRLERRIDHALRVACGLRHFVNGEGLENATARKCYAEGRERAAAKIAAALKKWRTNG